MDTGRIQWLYEKEPQKGEFVLYWMQQSQRGEENPALELAADLANRRNLPLLTVFVLAPTFPGARMRHYRFMAEGLEETAKTLQKRGVGFQILIGAPEEKVPEAAAKAAVLVTDMGYLRVQRQWRKEIARRLREVQGCPFVQVEGDVVVPVEKASGKEEYAARTIRPKIQGLLFSYLHRGRKIDLENKKGPNLPPLPGTTFRAGRINTDALLSYVEAPGGLPEISWLKGGYSRAKGLLEEFIHEKLPRYSENRNDPSLNIQSHLSHYLHFGQISPVEIAVKVQESGQPGAEEFLEQLIVRRELSCNFIFYNPSYDSYDAVPEWARKTLAAHRNDPRPYVYTLEELEQGTTHDRYWNAAMKEMKYSGSMKNYMRMYWGKKIIEWSPDPETAFERALYLNNTYFIDGRDPNSFTGVAWCFGKHDRPWKERSVFGQVRYMNDKGLERKFDIDSYVRQVDYNIEKGK